MSFPFNDQFWVAAAEFLKQHYQADEKVLAPDLFWRILPEVYRYSDTLAGSTPDYDWVVLHKGQLAELDRPFLESVVGTQKAVFANEVFVIFSGSGHPELASVIEHEHARSLAAMIEALEPAISPQQEIPAEGERQIIRNFTAMTDAEMREAMNEFWRAGGYKYETKRDQAYAREVEFYLVDFVGDAEGLQVLDLCCGDGRYLRNFGRAKSVIGVDLSDVAIGFAKQTMTAENLSFRQMDAHYLDFDDASFDIVMLTDSIEHVRDAQLVIREAARVMRPGGTFFVTVANRNSLHQVMTRKLGFPEFRTNHHHICEFDLDETRQLLVNAGLSVERQAGLFLFAYWGIPGIDQQVRHLIDEDAEVVELHRELGRLIGAEHAYCSVVLAKKLQ